MLDVNIKLLENNNNDLIVRKDRKKLYLMIYLIVKIFCNF